MWELDCYEAKENLYFNRRIDTKVDGYVLKGHTKDGVPAGNNNINLLESGPKIGPFTERQLQINK